MKQFLEIKSVTARYDNHIAISNISIKLELGKFHVIMGPNGGGKTTLIRAIAGLIPYSGKITIEDMDAKIYRKKNSIGYLAQRGAQFHDFPLNALEVVEMGRYRFKETSHVRKEKSLKFLEEVEMSSHVNDPIENLSGGQQQRVLIARALATESKLMLMDEPLTGMDPRTQSKFYEMLERLKKEHSLTIIMSSHDVGFTTAYAENVFCINRSLVPHNEAVKLLEEPEVVKLYGPNICLAKHYHTPSNGSEEEDV